VVAPFKIATKIDICIYHDPCSDGFGAAYAVWRSKNTARYIPAAHNKKLDEEYWLKIVKGKRVVVCDYAFTRQLTQKMHATADFFQVIDHHKSSIKSLGDLDYCYINTQHSGAMLTWLAFHSAPPPALIAYVEDQDLWKFNLENSREANIYIEAFPRSFGCWKNLEVNFADEKSALKCWIAGQEMLRYRDSLVRTAEPIAEDWLVAGQPVRAVNLPLLRPQVANQLIPKKGFGGTYWIQGGLVTWSLRSETSDCSELVGNFVGGGGHAEAAGFSLPVEKVDFVNRRVELPVP
jgi:uncharacterized protein